MKSPSSANRYSAIDMSHHTHNTSVSTGLPQSRTSGRTLEQTGHAHLVGICGSGMKALAELLNGSGWSVSGSDANANTPVAQNLAARGLRIHGGHHRGFLRDQTDLLVYSPAVGRDNAERIEARRRGIPEFSYSEMLGKLMAGKTGVCIAGTHGKSTTTAMIGCILTASQLSPSVVIGAEVCRVGVSGWSGTGPHFVVESCEFQQSFLDLSPQHAVILGIEPDHFDCFSHFDETVAAFARFAQKVPASGSLLIPANCEAAKAASLAAQAPLETFGVNIPADWQAVDLRPVREGTRFRVFHHGDFFAEILLGVVGKHNVSNALAATALAHAAGGTLEGVHEGLAEFPGVRRRFEVVGSWRGVTLIDDYAHHPTAVRAVLTTAREQYPGRRIWCVFQPHQVSRTRALFADFADSLTLADRTILTPVFAARETVQNEPVETSQALARQVASQGGTVEAVESLDQAVRTLEDDLLPGDVLITMGAGDISQVHYAFTRRLQRYHASE
jgi:UDP-N-acetylmuramate--alanine ligase